MYRHYSIGISEADTVENRRLDYTDPDCGVLAAPVFPLLAHTSICHASPPPDGVVTGTGLQSNHEAEQMTGDLAP